MAQANFRRTTLPAGRTFEGAPAARMSPVKALQKALYAHLLWEDSFYMSGQTAADALKAALVTALGADRGAAVRAIIESRVKMNIRTASLKCAVDAAKLIGGSGAVDLIDAVIRRADEAAEVIAMAGGKAGMTHAIRKGVARALTRFDAYGLMKYQGTGKTITTRDAIMLAHPRRTETIQKFLAGELPPADTWEVALSAGADKRETFERLLGENKLGAMALLRNLRNMHHADVKPTLIATAFQKADWSKVLPFRFLSAVREAPQYATLLNAAFAKAVTGSVYLPGTTAVLLDTSGSMGAPLSGKSSVKMVEAGACLAAGINGDSVRMFQFATMAREVPNFGGLGQALGMGCGQVGHGTEIEAGIKMVNAVCPGADRLIIVTDGQYAMGSTAPNAKHTYVLNIGPYAKTGIVHGPVAHLSGFSAQVLNWIAADEAA